MRDNKVVRKMLVFGIVFLLVIVVFAGMPMNVSAVGKISSYFAGGSGTVEDPYQISDVDELQSMYLDLDAHFILVNNIDASGTSTWNDGKGFLPIAYDLDPLTDNFQGPQFKGTLDGKGYKITGLYINRPSTDFIGLFGGTHLTSIIKNVGLENIDITGSEWMGVLVGDNSATISNSYATGSVSGFLCVGGLIGVNHGTILNSYSMCSTHGTKGAGGLVGSNWVLGSIFNSYATGSVSSSNDWSAVGGLAGSNLGLVSNSYAIGSVSGLQPVGGLIGYQYDGSTLNSYSISIVSGSSQVGGLVGSNVKDSSISNCYATGSVGASDSWSIAGGLVGSNTGLVSNSYATGSVSGIQGVGGLVGWNEDNVISNCYATGSVTGSYVTAGGLVGFNYNYGSISNCYATGIVSSGGYNAGGLVGNNFVHSSISNCYATGGVTGSNGNVGGLVGFNYDRSIITDCYATGSVSGGATAGGLVGYNYIHSSISNCYATGSVCTDSYNAGGLVGFNDYYSSISNSYATGSVTGGYYHAGGLVGFNYRYSSISNSYSTGSVSGPAYYGGLVGYSYYGITLGSYWDKETSGVSWSAGGTGKTTTQMKKQTTFVGWDFTNIWKIIEDVTYPYHRFPPVANAGPDQTALVGETVNFDGTGSYALLDKTIITYSWDFDDTNSGTGATPTHAYTSAGTYTVTLKVTDDDGESDSDMVTISVLTPVQANQYLITEIEEMDLSIGTETNLVSKLNDAVILLEKKNLNGAIHKMKDFIDYSRAQRGKKLTEEQADLLIEFAQRIIDNIN